MNIVYKELNLAPDTGIDFALTDEIKKFVKDIVLYKEPETYRYLTPLNSPRVITGYYLNMPFYYADNYITLFELIVNAGWEYKSTYYSDHKVLTFVMTVKEN